LDVFEEAKNTAIDSFVCPFIHKLGIGSIPAASLLIGELAVSYIFQYGVILPSPIGIELMEFPAKMIYALKISRILARNDNAG